MKKNQGLKDKPRTFIKQIPVSNEFLCNSSIEGN